MAARLLTLAALTAVLGGCGGSGGTGGDPCALRTPGAQWLAFSSNRTGGRYQVWITRDDGTCAAQVTQGDSNALYATWSPDGAIAFARQGASVLSVHVVDVATGVERLLDTGGLSATSPAYSPDGRWIAFEGEEPGVNDVSDIYVVPAAGGVPRKVTSSQGFNAGPAWSPDGRTLYFVSNRVPGYDVWKVPFEGGTETVIPSTRGVYGRPVASPDGSSIAYAMPASGGALVQVVVQTLSTGQVRSLSARTDSEPAYNRDGSQVVVTAQRDGNAELYVLASSSGAVVRRLTEVPGSDGLAAYAPFP